MITIDCIAVPSHPSVVSIPLAQLGDSHGVSASKAKMYERYYGLRTVARSMLPNRHMLASALTRLSECCALQHHQDGLLIYAKTQTHNTLFELDWLRELSSSYGLGHWERLAVSMNHCASALSVLHLLNSTAEQRLVILLTGEKSFHPVVSRLSTGLLGEMPVAMLLNAGCGVWRIAHTEVSHEPRFYENPDDMSKVVRAAFQTRFSDGLLEFIERTLDNSDLEPAEVDLIIPYNLNLPLLRRIADHFSWQDKLFTENIPSTGHLYCSDVLFNLAGVLPVTSARRIVAFAAGMGVTFASLLLERA